MSTHVPMLDLHRQFASIREEVLPAVERVCTSQQYILGPEVTELEREISAYIGCAETVACSSGTDALWLALLAAGVGPGQAVVTTSFSFFATASSIIRCGATPVFADIDEKSYNLNPVSVLQAIAKARSQNMRATAILPVHLYGQCADMDALSAMAAEHKLEVVEDAAQAFGATWGVGGVGGVGGNSHKAGALSKVAAFSFYPTKNLSAAGDAGCVTTTDPEWGARMKRLRNHGSPKRYLHDEIGWNTRMDSIQAAVLRIKLRHLPTWNAKRRDIAHHYTHLFQQAGLASPQGPLVLPTEDPRGYHIYHQYVIRAPRRDDLRNYLTEKKIGSEVYYPIPLHLQPSLAYLGCQAGDLPETERAAAEVLALPMFPELREDEQETVVGRIAEFYS